MRAYENLVAVAMANYAGPGAGHSVAYDPIGFPVHGGKASWRDTLVVEAGEREGISLASFDLDAIRAYRTYETEGNAFRKPHRYGLLTSPDVAEPFVRVSATGEPFNRTKR